MHKVLQNIYSLTSSVFRPSNTSTLKAENNNTDSKVASVAFNNINRRGVEKESSTDEELSSLSSHSSESVQPPSPPTTPSTSSYNSFSSKKVVQYQHNTNYSEDFTQENFSSNYAFLMSEAKAALDLNNFHLGTNTINLAKELMNNVQALNSANEDLLSILGEIQAYYSEKHAPNANNNIFYSRQNSHNTAEQILEKFNIQKGLAKKARAYLFTNKVSLKDCEELNTVIIRSESAYDLLEKHLLGHGESLVQQMDFREKLQKNNTQSIEEIETIISICDNYQKLESHPNTYKAQESRQSYTSNEYTAFEQIWKNNHYAFDLLVHRKDMVKSKLELALKALHQLIQNNKQSAENLKQHASTAPSVSPINFSEIFTLQNIQQFIWTGLDLNTPMIQKDELHLETTKKNNENYNRILKRVPEIADDRLKVEIETLERDISDTNKTIEDIEKNRWMTNASQKFSVIAKGMSSGLLLGGSIVFTVLGTARIASFAERMLFKGWR